MTTQTIRYKRVSESPWVNAESKVTHSHYMNSDDSRCKYSHTFYLHFYKEDFPYFDYPKLIDTESRKMFDYYSSSFGRLDFHGGITFYSEKINVESGKTNITIGCDYQHYMDDHYSWDDNGEQILKSEGKKMCREFLDLHEVLKTHRLETEVES